MNKKYNEIAFTGVVIIFLMVRCTDGPQVYDPTDDTSVYTIELDNVTFDSLVNNNNGVVVVEFYSKGCLSCLAMNPIYDSIGMVYGDSLLVARVDADAHKQLTETYSITVVPSFSYFSGGTIIRVESMTADEHAFDTLSDRVQHLLNGTLSAIETDTSDKNNSSLTGYITLDSLTFDSIIMKPGRVAMAFFMVPAGFPCQQMDSVVREMAPQFDGRAVIAKVIVVWEVEPLSQRYGITSVPRFLFFKDGEQIIEEQRLGVFEGDTLAAVLERLLAE